MNLEVIVRLKDLLSRPLRGLRNALDGIGKTARQISLVSGAIAAISFMGPMQEAAAFQQQLLDIAGTSNLIGDQAFAMVDQSKERYEALALSIGQYSDTVAKGAGQMIAAGLDQKLVDQSIGSIGRAATAANAEFADMSGVATQLLQTLRIPADQLDNALGALVTAGKLGSFELKDMAKYFPTLTSQMVKFGVTGREAVNFLASALQIARKGTSDPAEAANNLKNFLSKILAPATIKNFKDAGVDIEAVMRDAATKGINPIEAVVQKITKLTGVSGKEIEGLLKKAKANGLEGADALASVREQLEKIHGAGALGEIFGDMQVMDFLIPMLANIDEYKQIKEEVAKATGAVIDGDFETQMDGLNRQLITFGEIGTQVSREVGFAFGTLMPTINAYLMDTLKWLRELDKETGGMVRQGLAFAGVAVLVATALGTLGFVLPAIGAALSALAALASPVGLVLVAIGAAGVHIYRNWATYGPKLQQMWAGLNRGIQKLTGVDLSALTLDDVKVAGWNALGRAMNVLSIAWEGVKDFGSGFAPYLDGIGENAGQTIDAVKGIADGIVRLASGLATLVGLGDGKVGSLFSTLGKIAGMGLDLAVEVIRNLAQAVETLVNGLADLVEAINKGINWGALIPSGVADAWNSLASTIQAVKAAIGGSGGEPGTRVGRYGWTPANQNAVPAEPLPAQAAGGNSTLDVNTQATVKVIGPGEVVSQQTATSSPSPNINTGRAVGRD